MQDQWQDLIDRLIPAGYRVLNDGPGREVLSHEIWEHGIVYGTVLDAIDAARLDARRDMAIEFHAEDYAEVRTRMERAIDKQNEHDLRAVMSNNFNIILAALKIAEAATEVHTPASA